MDIDKNSILNALSNATPFELLEAAKTAAHQIRAERNDETFTNGMDKVKKFAENYGHANRKLAATYLSDTGNEDDVMSPPELSWMYMDCIQFMIRHLMEMHQPGEQVMWAQVIGEMMSFGNIMAETADGLGLWDAEPIPAAIHPEQRNVPKDAA